MGYPDCPGDRELWRLAGDADRRPGPRDAVPRRGRCRVPADRDAHGVLALGYRCRSSDCA